MKLGAGRILPFTLTAVALCFGNALLFAGGPIQVLPGGFFLRWNPAQPVGFAIDQGPLSDLVSNEQGAELVRSSAQAWEDVETSSLKFEDLGFLDRDVKTPADLQAVLGVPNRSAIVFDADGSLTDALLGAGSSQSVLGFASAFANPAGTEFLSGVAILNGTKALQSTFPQVVTHELGHLIGLDHSQGLLENAFGVGSLNFRQHLPIMFPLIFSTGPSEPQLDDVVWLSWMYPQGTHLQEEAGTIRGQVFRRSGFPLANANVVAVRVEEQEDGALIESREIFVSVVSDFLRTGDGAYELPGLPPGDYAVYIEPIHASFVNGSSVGPHPFFFSDFPKDYFNENESGDSALDDPGEITVIEVKAGMTVEGIHLISNEPANQLHLLDDDDEMLVEFPEGFRFPFFGKSYAAIIVNSDGHLTFGLGDSAPGQARDEIRFLSGPPRIGVLFSDLDPSQGGEVREEIGQDFVRFIWDGVPEFGAPPGDPGNVFQVTLHRNGDIEFQYERLRITPDFDLNFPQQGLGAIVGISPGGREDGQPIDFSDSAEPIAIGFDPIYQIFPGNTLNLEGRTILFAASDVELLFPFYQGDSVNFTGFAVTNFGETEALLQYEGFDADGQPLLFPGNPSGANVPAGGYLARLGTEIFQIPLATPQNGWVRIRSSSPDVGSFFQFGNGLVGPLTRVDGSVAFTETSNQLFFTRIHHGPQSFPLPLAQNILSAQTTLFIANPNPEAVTLTLRLFAAGGLPVGNPSVRDLPANGLLSGNLVDLFPQSLLPGSSLSGGFVQVDSSGGGVVGFQLIEVGDGDTAFGLNAAFPSDDEVLYSAQLGHGDAVFTNLKVINTTDDLKVIVVSALITMEDGSVGTPVENQWILGPKQSLQQDAAQWFNFPPPSSQFIVGSIRISTPEPGGIVGDVLFGDPQRADYGAALPLQGQLFRHGVFSQVANGTLDPNDPSMETFTGLALFNPNPVPATAVIRIFRSSGELVGQAERILQAGQRMSQTLEELAPASADVIGGYTIVTSNQPLVGQVLFGNSTLQFLSAVPPRIVE